MPRPKVAPHQRQRVAEACNSCREAKKRCSGSAPCTQCLRRGLERQCFITDVPWGSRRRTRARTAAIHAACVTPGVSRPQEQDAPVPLGPGNERQLEARNIDVSDSFQPMSPSESHDDVQSCDTNDCTDASSATNPPRMLLNLCGERVFIGSAASISFLQVIRRIVAQQIGPSPFSHNDKNDLMLEMKSARDVNAPPEPELEVPELTAELKQKYLQSYYIVTEGLMHVFDPSELEALVMLPARNTASCVSVSRVSTVNLVIAIGAQCESAASAQTVGQAYFREARRRVFTGLLEDPDMDMVRTFLLMAFYMLGECRRNAAFMYLGIAVRAALALGLHSRDSYSEKPGTADQQRLRLWMSVCIVEKLVNSILGRPAATAGVHPEHRNDALESFAKSGDDVMDCLTAAHSIVSIINDVTDKIYDKKEITTPVVQQLLHGIEKWKRELPESVRNPPSSGDESGSFSVQKGIIARVHVSCLYYFAVTLVTRPFLISKLTSQSSPATMHSHLAAACLDAAMYLAQTCVEACNAGLLQGNMCIMKALVFAAGLVLGFEIFASNSTDNDIEQAFKSAQEVLSYLSAQSPQAAHYLEILTSLSTAISKRRSKDTSAGKSRYVSRIFSLNPVAIEGPRGETQLAWPQAFPVDSQSMLQGDNFRPPSLAFPEVGAGDLDLDWESLNISQWDSFPFLS